MNNALNLIVLSVILQNLRRHLGPEWLRHSW